MLEYNNQGKTMLLKVRYMRRQDIAQVIEIDHDAFPTEWPPTNFPRELENKLAYYIIAYENKDTNHQPDPKSTGKEIQPGFFSRVRRIFSRNQAPNQDPPEEISILGYAGMWIMADEAHVTSIASHKEHRHQGIGEALLITLVELAITKRARIVTLEARVSNQVAQNMYYKFGFDKLGVRKAYYLDNKEDAVIMSTEYIGSPSFKEKFTQAKRVYQQKCGTFTNELPVS
jgi:ribosomal-protein-alanine N-acetyltransferase